ARPESATDRSPADALIECAGVKRDASTFAVAIHAEVVRRAAAEPIHRGQHLLHLKAGGRASHFVGHAIEELAVWLIGHAAQLRIARPGVVPIDECRHDYA